MLPWNRKRIPGKHFCFLTNHLKATSDKGFGQVCWNKSLRCQRSKAIHNHNIQTDDSHLVGTNLLDVKDRKQFTTAMK